MGKFKIFKENGELISEFSNHFVDSGKQCALDFMFGNACWLSGETWTGTRYIGVGTSTDTNGNQTGPTNTTPVVIGGAWDGVSDSDYKLTSEISGTSRAVLTSVRTNNTSHIYARIGDTNVDYGTGTSIDIYEIGIFLASGYGPAKDPTSSTGYRKDAMLVRGVSYYTQGAEYYGRPLTKNIGEDLIVQYVFADFEG